MTFDSTDNCDRIYDLWLFNTVSAKYSISLLYMKFRLNFTNLVKEMKIVRTSDIDIRYFFVLFNFADNVIVIWLVFSEVRLENNIVILPVTSVNNRDTSRSTINNHQGQCSMKNRNECIRKLRDFRLSSV
jgi:hypothetical protein